MFSAPETFGGRLVGGVEQDRGDGGGVAHRIRERLRLEDRHGVRIDEMPIPEGAIVRPDGRKIAFGELMLPGRRMGEVEGIAFEDSMPKVAGDEQIVKREGDR